MKSSAAKEDSFLSINAVNDNFLTAHLLAVKLMEQIYLSGLNISDVKMAEKLSKIIISIVHKDKDFLDIIKNFNNYKPFACTHPFLVCVFSVMMCKKLKWNSSRTLKVVAMGGLLHDIGLRTLPEDMHRLAVKDFTPEQFAIFQTHPEAGMKMAAQFSEIPSSVLQVILQHSECGGKGFPNKLSRVKIYPLARVVCLADKLTRILLEHNVTAVEGLKLFLGMKEDLLLHDPDLIRALISSFFMEEKSDLKEIK